MRYLIPLALVASLFAMPLMAAPQAHGGGGGGGHAASMSAHVPVNHDMHGDAVSAQAKSAKAADEKVGPQVRDVAHDKSHGKGLTKAHGKGH